jgi:hypothetical protein
MLDCYNDRRPVPPDLLIALAAIRARRLIVLRREPVELGSLLGGLLFEGF